MIRQTWQRLWPRRRRPQPLDAVDEAKLYAAWYVKNYRASKRNPAQIRGRGPDKAA